MSSAYWPIRTIMVGGMKSVMMMMMMMMMIVT